MAIPRQQPSSLFELQFPQSVGIFNSYADAQKAVDYLSDQKFEVQNLAIVGTDLKSVERVLGRRNWGTVVTQGVQSGISTGLLVALAMLISAVVQLQAWLGYFNRYRRVAVQNLAMMWYFNIVAWLVVAAVIYATPYLL